MLGFLTLIVIFWLAIVIDDEVFDRAGVKFIYHRILVPEAEFIRNLTRWIWKGGR